MPLRQTLEAFRAIDPKNLRAHAGLWIDKMFPDQEASSELAGPLLKAIARPPIPEGYDVAFAARRRGFEAQADQESATLFDAEVLGRMVIGLGAKGVLEMGITLDHTWGVPFLPGSALKGIAAAAAHRFSGDKDWQKFDNWPEAAPAPSAAQLTDYQVLFGTTGNGGVVTFHDAWWNPAGESAVPLELDVMTVHHPDYYQANDDPAAPTDFDQPVPVPFLSGRGKFLIVLEGPAAWTKAAAEWLRIGLRELGIGAKTSSGYGRIELTERVSDAVRSRLAKAEAMKHALAGYKINARQAAVEAVIAALNAGVGEDRLRECLALVPKDQRAGLVEALVTKAPDHAVVIASARAALARPSPAAAPTPVAVPKPGPAPEPTATSTRALYEGDRKNPKRFFIRFEDEDKAHKGHTLDIDPDLLEAMRTSGDWVDVVVTIVGAKRSLRRA